MAKTVRLRPWMQIVRSPFLLWEATGTPGLFPKMETDLILSATGPERSHLTFQGSYRPPLGKVGRALDRTVLHRLGESNVKGFVDRLAQTIVNGVRAPALVSGLHGRRRRET